MQETNMKDYKGLRALMRTFRTLGWIVFVGSFLLACGAVFFGPSVARDQPLTAGILATVGLLIGPAILVNGAIVSATLFFAAGMLELLIDISVQTFGARELLKRALTPPPSPAPPAKPSRPPYQASRP
jgi:hypothetical protein